MNRKFYLVVCAAVVLAMVLSGLYLRQRAKAAAARPGPGQAVNCDTPAPPPKSTTPPPKLPGFQIEAACGSEPAAPAKAPKAPDRKKQ